MRIGREHILTFLRTVRGFVRGLWSSEGSVAQKTVRGGAWGFGGNASLQLIGIVQIAILARLLTPRDWGLWQMAMVVVAASATFSNFGVSTALVQRKDVSRETLDTAWVLDMARNILVCAMMWALSSPVAAYYHQPILAPLVRVISLKFFLTAFRNVGIVLLYRDMDFRRKQIYDASLDMASKLGTLVFAFWLRSVWAFAVGQLILGLGELVGSYIIQPFRPRFRFHVAEARSLIRFGKHIFFGGVLNFLRGSLDSILLGRLLGMETLGIYALARNLVSKPAATFSPIFSDVLYPAFARLQDKVELLRRGFLRATGVGCLIMCPALAGIAFTSVPVVHVLYGQKYAGAALFTSAFCLAELLGFLAISGNSMLLARGKPALNNLTSLAACVTMVLLLWLLAPRYGVMGVIAAMTCARLVAWVAVTAWVREEIGLPMGGLALAIGRPLAASVAMGAGVWALSALAPMRPGLAVAVLVATGVALYLAASTLFNRDGWADAWRAFAGASRS